LPETGVYPLNPRPGTRKAGRCTTVCKGGTLYISWDDRRIAVRGSPRWAMGFVTMGTVLFPWIAIQESGVVACYFVVVRVLDGEASP